MKNKNVRGILALIIVTALSFGVIAGSKALAKNQSTDQGQDKAQITEELDVTGAENIQSAARTEEGYLVTVTEAGYGGDIVLEVSFGEDKATVTNVAVTEQNETEGVGSKITEEEFLSQFAGAKAPVYLPGMTLEEDTASVQAEDLELQDGTYEAKAEAPDNNGYIDQMTMTVSEGKITEAVWDAVDGDGNKKSELSENGQYVMTEDGPTWAEQSKALGEALVENQSLAFLTMDNQGKTDAVSGVSISVGGFAKLAQQCIDQASGKAVLVLQDGTYEAKTETPDSNGYTDQVTITVADGKITEAVWESVDADGNKKSELSENGQYVMTEDGPTWAEQSKALGAALVENQNLDFLTTDNQGKTDAVSGVSISVGGFVKLAQQCIDQAGGMESQGGSESTQEGTEVDGVSGATISSTAAVKGINAAYEFLQTID